MKMSLSELNISVSLSVVCQGVELQLLAMLSLALVKTIDSQPQQYAIRHHDVTHITLFQCVVPVNITTDSH